MMRCSSTTIIETFAMSSILRINYSWIVIYKDWEISSGKGSSFSLFLVSCIYCLICLSCGCQFWMFFVDIMGLMELGSNGQNMHDQEQQKARWLMKFLLLREPNRIPLEIVVVDKWFPDENPIVVRRICKFSCVKKKRSSFVHLVLSINVAIESHSLDLFISSGNEW